MTADEARAAQLETLKQYTDEIEELIKETVRSPGPEYINWKIPFDFTEAIPIVASYLEKQGYSITVNDYTYQMKISWAEEQA